MTAQQDLEIRLRDIVRTRINHKTITKEHDKPYDGFDMSGFGVAMYKNLELISRFSDILVDTNIHPKPYTIVPMFWKGSCSIAAVSEQKVTLIDEMSGMTTEDILVKVIQLQNPNWAKSINI